MNKMGKISRRELWVVFLSILFVTTLFIVAPTPKQYYRSQTEVWSGNDNGIVGFWAGFPSTPHDVIQLVNDTKAANCNCIYLTFKSKYMQNYLFEFDMLLNITFEEDIKIILIMYPFNRGAEAADSPYVTGTQFDELNFSEYLWWETEEPPSFTGTGLISYHDYVWWAMFLAEIAKHWTHIIGLSIDDWMWNIGFTIMGIWIWFFHPVNAYQMRIEVKRINPKFLLLAVWYYYHKQQLSEWADCFDGFMFFYGGFGSIGYLDGISVECDDIPNPELQDNPDWLLNRDAIIETQWFDAEMRELTRRMPNKVLIVGLYCIIQSGWRPIDGSNWTFSYAQELIPKAYDWSKAVCIFSHGRYANGSIQRDMLDDLGELVGGLKGYETPFDTSNYEDEEPPQFTDPYLTVTLVDFGYDIIKYRFSFGVTATDDLGVRTVQFVYLNKFDNNVTVTLQQSYHYDDQYFGSFYYPDSDYVQGGWFRIEDYYGNVVWSNFTTPVVEEG